MQVHGVSRQVNMYDVSRPNHDRSVELRSLALDYDTLLCDRYLEFLGLLENAGANFILVLRCVGVPRGFVFNLILKLIVLQITRPHFTSHVNRSHNYENSPKHFDAAHSAPRGRLRSQFTRAQGPELVENTLLLRRC